MTCEGSVVQAFLLVLDKSVVRCMHRCLKVQGFEDRISVAAPSMYSSLVHDLLILFQIFAEIRNVAELYFSLFIISSHNVVESLLYIVNVHCKLPIGGNNSYRRYRY
jgi:hypothetical protein